MNSETPLRPRSSALFAAVGAFQGLLLWWLSQAATERSWPATSPGADSALWLWAVFLPPLIYLLSDWARLGRAWVVVVVTALLLAGAGMHFGLHIEQADPERLPASSGLFVLFLTAFVFLFHAVPFAQIFLANGRWRPDYGQLFFYTWRNALLLALAALFTGVFWLLLQLWIALFAMIGLHFPRVLFLGDASFSLLVAAIVFGFGFHLAGSADRLLLALRQQVLALLKWLALVATCILVVFTVALLLRAPALMAEHRHVISATWLLWLAVVTVYLYNAGFQDGQTAEPYPPLAGKLLRYATPLLLLVSGLAAYALLVRVNAYGLTVSRVWGLLVALIALAYAASYCWAALRPGSWMHSMGSANVMVALMLLLALGLMQSPVLAPERLAARSLGQRLLHESGTDEAQTLMALRFDLGVYGRSALRELAAAANASATVRTRAADALKVERLADRYAFTQAHKLVTNLALQAIPEGSDIDDALRAAIATAFGPFEMTFAEVDQDEDSSVGSGRIGGVHAVRSTLCTTANPCPVLFIDLDGDSVAEAVAFWHSVAHVFKKEEGKWVAVNSVRVSSCRCSETELRRALNSGQYQVSEPKYKDLQVGREKFVVTGRD